MPANLLTAVPVAGTVLPKSLSQSFVLSLVYPLLSVTYNDGTFERSLIVDNVNAPRPLRIWVMALRQTTTQLNSLFTFWKTNAKGGLNPFYFYDPFDVVPPAHIGSNYDPAGNNTQGRAIVYFRGDWAQRTDMGRHSIPNLTLVEVA